MAYVRKTKDVYELITNYGYGEDVECTYDSIKEAREDLRVYLEERRLGYLPELRSIRIKTRRVRKEN